MTRVPHPSQVTTCLPDRQTDSFNWDTNPHTPRLYFKPAPPLHLPRYTDLQGLHQLIMDVEKYYASPAGSRRRPRVWHLQRPGAPPAGPAERPGWYEVLRNRRIRFLLYSEHANMIWIEKHRDT